MIFKIIAFLLFFKFTYAQSQQYDNTRRLALVIANGSYPQFPLSNPINDAMDIAASLEKVGFTVIFEENLTNNSFRNVLRTFGEQLKQYDVGLFYYAGHGVQVHGINYLLPVDADIKYEDEIQSQAIEAGLVLRKMGSAKVDVNILILDACRNNPFSRGFRGVNPGLAVMNAPKGTIIAYSTAPGHTAEDGRGRNSPYAEQLLKSIEIPGITIEKLFKYVRVGLSLETEGRQISWESSSLMGDFYFISPDYFDVNKSRSLFGSLEIYMKLLDNPTVSIDGIDIGSCVGNICSKDLIQGWHHIQVKAGGKIIDRNVQIYPRQKSFINIDPLVEIQKGDNRHYIRNRSKKNRSNSLPPP
jgi:hypothetical protein